MEKKQLLFELKRYIFFLCNISEVVLSSYIIMSSLFFFFYLFAYLRSFVLIYEK